jgi:periplasmic divalent cation tolerance protein
MAERAHEVRFIYITAPTKAEAQLIGRTVVEERLAASANIFENMEAIYWWGDELQETGEVVIIAQTRADLAEALVERIKSMHSYACPCILVLPIASGNPAFLDWIAAETRPAETLKR